MERFLAGSLVMSQAPLRVRANGMKLAPTLRNFLSISLDMSATHDFCVQKMQCLFLQPDRQKKTEAWNQTPFALSFGRISSVALNTA